MKRKPRRNIGELGSFRISRMDQGHAVEQIKSQVPDTKDEAEAFFASIFVEEYNRTLPIGQEYPISLGRQNDTSERDFNIFSIRAERLELAELTPLSAPFGKHAKATGKLNIYEYAEWIYRSIIAAKEVKYRRNGVDIQKIILALYLTHMEFAPSDNVINCLRQLCKERCCIFEAVFVLLTNGSDLRVLSSDTHIRSASFPLQLRSKA